MTCTNIYYSGKDNFAADRELGEKTLAAYPNLVYSVRANRAFLVRAVRFLAAEMGIRQFLDIGTGMAILAKAASTLDFGRPVAIMLIAVMHFVRDDSQAGAIVRRLTDACAPGSFVTISHAASDIDAKQQTEMVRRLNESVAEKATLRDRAGVTRLFDGLDLAEPGVVRVADWRPDSDVEAASPTGLWGGVARKP
ncbi:MAG: SAM-dependent methyltransferase [Streptosporangiaceae bacterium]